MGRCNPRGLEEEGEEVIPVSIFYTNARRFHDEVIYEDHEVEVVTLKRKLARDRYDEWVRRIQEEARDIAVVGNYYSRRGKFMLTPKKWKEYQIEMDRMELESDEREKL